MRGMDSYRKRQRRAARKKHNTRRNIEMLRMMRACAGCAVCGESDPCCLHFHHVRGKAFELSRAKRCPSALLAETAKCVVLCANCHAKVHDAVETLMEFCEVKRLAKREPTLF
jgi:5-methylcytosine-specific restriction endonuclease McrA